MKKETQKKVYEIEITAAIILILVIVMSFFKPTITGFVSADVYTQDLDLTIKESSSYTLSSKEEFVIDSFRVSGEVSGDGLARVYLKNKEQHVLIYANAEGDYGLNAITGMAVKGGGEGRHEAKLNLVKDGRFLMKVHSYSLENKKLVFGGFEKACEETCSMYMHLSENQAHKLVVVLDGGAVLHIKEITYSVSEER